MPANVSVIRGCGLLPSGIVVGDDEPPGSASRAGESGNRLAVWPSGPRPRWTRSIGTERGDQQVVGVVAVVAAHREEGVDARPPVAAAPPGQAVVGVGVVEGHAALVAPVDLGRPPVDR